MCVCVFSTLLWGQFEGVAGKDWAKGETRTSKIVFIGKNLDREAIEEDLKECLC